MKPLLYHVHEVHRQQPAGLRAWIDRPRPGQLCDGRLLEIEGWALDIGEGPGQVAAVEVCCGGEVIGRASLDVARQDVDDPSEAGARCGYRARVGLNVAGPVTLELRAVLSDQQRADLGRIELEGRWRGDEAEPALISVVVPCYGQAHFLDQAIDSVLAQRYPHLELVVVDDGSTDNTAAVAGRYPGVRYVRQPGNRGLAEARNAGIRHSSGAYLVFLDADDRLLPEALSTHLGLLEAERDWAFVFGQHRLVDYDGSPIWDWREQGIPRTGYAALLRRNPIAVPGAVMYRRAALEGGGFDGRIDSCADYELYLRIARGAPFGSHDGIVCEYRRHGGAMTRDQGRIAADALSALRRQWPHVRRAPALRRAYCEGLVFWRVEHDGGRWLGAGGLRRLPATAGDLAILARYHPVGLAELLRAR